MTAISSLTVACAFCAASCVFAVRCSLYAFAALPAVSTASSALTALYSALILANRSFISRCVAASAVAKRSGWYCLPYCLKAFVRSSRLSMSLKYSRCAFCAVAPSAFPPSEEASVRQKKPTAAWKSISFASSSPEIATSS